MTVFHLSILFQENRETYTRSNRSIYLLGLQVAVDS